MADDKKYTIEQLKAIISAGMAPSEAKALLREGYTPEDVLELAQLQAATTQAKAIDAQTAAAKTMQKAMKPENESHPHISAFSYPEGDIAHPKATLPCEFWYNGYPCHMFPETEHWREMELMAQVTPGVFTVLRKDGTLMEVTVKGERDASQKLTKLSVEFPVTREEKWLIPPKTVLLYQLVHSDNPRKRFLEAMHEHLTVMMGAEVSA
jgi:hypothetical protein